MPVALRYQETVWKLLHDLTVSFVDNPKSVSVLLCPILKKGTPFPTKTNKIDFLFGFHCKFIFPFLSNTSLNKTKIFKQFAVHGQQNI